MEELEINRVAGGNLNGIGSAFMIRSPNCSVVRLRIRPKEGYIAPTENIVHDGSSEGTVSPSSQFIVMGNFDPYPVRSG